MIFRVTCRNRSYARAIRQLKDGYDGARLGRHMRLSIIIPVHNERATIRQILERLDKVDLNKEVVIVDDYSTDGTRDVLAELDRKGRTVVFHEWNQGKGAALRTGLRYVTGDCVIVQDADLEYDPNDYHKLVSALEERRADVVYGSRFAGEQPSMALRHRVGNRLLTGLTNLLYGSALTDMETCYKLLRREAFAGIELTSDRFNVEPELTAKLLKKGITIHEVPISYAGRSFAEGKKISWADFVSAVWTLVKCRVAG